MDNATRPVPLPKNTVPPCHIILGFAPSLTGISSLLLDIGYIDNKLKTKEISHKMCDVCTDIVMKKSGVYGET
jgi:hypothetical protein